jgi:dCTP deaminase
MTLCDKTIRLRADKDKLIETFNENQLTPNGYDLSIEKIELIANKEELKPKPDGIISVPAHSVFIILTKEWVNMPADLVGTLWIRTRYARKGIELRPGPVDAGFKGNLNLCMTNTTEGFIDIDSKETIAQIMFHELDEPAEKTYEKRSGNYQNQNKITK